MGVDLAIVGKSGNPITSPFILCITNDMEIKRWTCVNSIMPKDKNGKIKVIN